MSLTDTSKSIVTSKDSRILNLKYLKVGLGLLVTITVLLRTYEQLYGWTTRGEYSENDEDFRIEIVDRFSADAGLPNNSGVSVADSPLWRWASNPILPQDWRHNFPAQRSLGRAF